MAKSKKPKLTGSKRMREMGYKRVEVWLSPKQVEYCERAAELVRRKLATFVCEAAVGSATVVLQAEAAQQQPNEQMWRSMVGPTNI